MIILVGCDNVSRIYGSGESATVALRATSCSVQSGARIAITGASGSGKSTLIHLMAGLDDPSSGVVSWPALGSRAALRPGPVAMVFQGPSLLPPLSVIENVALPRQLAGVGIAASVDEARAALARLELLEIADKLPDEISGGQAQRVAVARALATGPALIFADEPTSQLDRESGAHVIDVLLETADATGAALVVATHDPTIAGRFATHWVVADGVVTAE